MPKAKEKRKGRTSQQSDDSDDDHEVSASQSQVSRSQQPTSTQADRSLAQLSLEEREQIVNDIVRYLLVADQKKLPIKKADIVKHVAKEHSRAFATLMKSACDKLRAVFGIDAVFDEKSKGYVLVNTLDNMYDDPHQMWPPEDEARTGLVMVILTAIFMKGNEIDDEALYDMLRRLGVDVDNRDETFGDVRYLVTNLFVRQGYLEVEREQGDPPRCIFRWGSRARLETSKQQCLDFVDQVFGEQDSHRWAAQKREIEMTAAASHNGETSRD